jgi:hypothetical protein
LAKKVGDRYLVSDSIRTHPMYIIEYDGHEWVQTQLDNRKPCMIYLIESNSSIIAHNNHLWSTSHFFICDDCNRVLSLSLKVNNVCIECHFVRHYDNSNRKEYDGKPLSIGKYIFESKPYHNMKTCLHKDKCFICDYLSGKLMLDIVDAHLLYDSQTLKKLHDETVIVVI